MFLRTLAEFVKKGVDEVTRIGCVVELNHCLAPDVSHHRMCMEASDQGLGPHGWGAIRESALNLFAFEPLGQLSVKSLWWRLVGLKSLVWSGRNPAARSKFIAGIASWKKLNRLLATRTNCA